MSECNFSSLALLVNVGSLLYVCMHVCMGIYTYYGMFVCMCVVNVD